ncbi:Vinculin/alpha-catenin [Cladochytrium replicatum]|nr:Vinculin/alpha-catenin [Cladochytrium replicatum]
MKLLDARFARAVTSEIVGLGHQLGNAQNLAERLENDVNGSFSCKIDRLTRIAEFALRLGDLKDGENHNSCPSIVRRALNLGRSAVQKGKNDRAGEVITSLEDLKHALDAATSSLVHSNAVFMGDDRAVGARMAIQSSLAKLSKVLDAESKELNANLNNSSSSSNQTSIQRISAAEVLETASDWVRIAKMETQEFSGKNTQELTDKITTVESDLVALKHRLTPADHAKNNHIHTTTSVHQLRDKLLNEINNANELIIAQRNGLEDEEVVAAKQAAAIAEKRAREEREAAEAVRAEELRLNREEEEKQRAKEEADERERRRMAEEAAREEEERIKREQVQIEEEALLLAEQMGQVVVIDGEAPRLLSEEEASSNPIKAAAQEIRVEASTWASEENSIVSFAQQVSDCLEILSQHHAALRQSPKNPIAKSAFIKAATDIANRAISLAREAEPLSKVCTDKRLRASLIGSTDRITTLVQQLKIVAAVKASSPADADRDVQLIACAQNITSSVKMCLRSCEAASLRISPSTAPSVKFRKVVYRRKQFGAA